MILIIFAPNPPYIVVFQQVLQNLLGSKIQYQDDN